MSTRELDAAGITDPGLRASYERCRLLNASHGRTYYLATLLLPVWKRPYVHALYGFARWADELVDSFTDADPDELVRWGARFESDLLEGARGDEVTAAVLHTARTWDIEPVHFRDFLLSMRMDIDTTGYATYADLETYVHGSAAVIGLEVLPVLGSLTDEAAPRAAALGVAFQLSNFLRDVGEDLRRGRVYLPQEDLDAFGVTSEALRRGVVTPAVRELLRFEVDRTRTLYAFAQEGVAMVHPTSRDCLRTAIDLYGGILDRVEDADYQVLTQRVGVPLARRARVAGPGLVRAALARHRSPVPRVRPAAA